MIRISEAPFDPGEELKRFEKSAVNPGGIVSFVGKVRLEAKGAPVRALALEHYPGVTESSITTIEREARARWAIGEPLIIHRIGRLEAGAPIVMVCVSAVHRREAFEAADFLMDYLKTEALFWKKEIREDGEEWIEPRARDYDDAARWRKNKETR